MTRAPRDAAPRAASSSDETLALDGRLRAALELPLHEFPQGRAGRRPARRFALAASVVLAMLLGGGFWLLGPQIALAGEVVEHVRHESGSWDAQRVGAAGRSSPTCCRRPVCNSTRRCPVVYASACPFRGHRVPHLVVQTADGPMTVMLLAHEKVREAAGILGRRLSRRDAAGGRGQRRVLARDGAVPDDARGDSSSAALAGSQHFAAGLRCRRAAPRNSGSHSRIPSSTR